MASAMITPIHERLGPAGTRIRKAEADTMPKPPLDPPVADRAPTGGDLTSYDNEHLVTYLRLLDADAEGADWAEVARIVLHIDPSREPERARRAFDSHLARAKWMTQHGYQHLLRGSTPD
jgi:hypothetical protein